MYAYIRDGEVRQVDVSGNAETVFFPQDEQSGDWLGVNKTQSAFVRLFIKDEKVDHVVFTSATTGTMYPIDQLSDEQTHLSQFFWAEEQRPLKPGDVFDSPKSEAKPEGDESLHPEGNTDEDKAILGTPPDDFRTIDKNKGENAPEGGSTKLKKRN